MGATGEPHRAQVALLVEWNSATCIEFAWLNALTQAQTRRSRFARLAPV
jgi:hypothetical protein